MSKQFKILLATDYSPAAKNAEKFAFQLAVETNSVLIIVNVNDNSIHTMNNSTSEDVRQLQEHIFWHTVSGHFIVSNINYECVVRRGEPVRQICEEAMDLDVDFIIAGARGMDKTEGPLGHLTRELILKANLPVIAVPEDAAYNKIKRVVFVINNREGELPVINHLSKFCRMLGASLTILNLATSAMSPEFERQLRQQFIEEIRSRISYGDIDFQVLHSADIAGALEAYCIESKTDLLVMSPERPVIFESIFSESTRSESYLYRKIPLFTIPDFYSPDYSWFWRSLVPNHNGHNPQEY